jgi:hypothetical protein
MVSSAVPVRPSSTVTEVACGSAGLENEMGIRHKFILVLVSILVLMFMNETKIFQYFNTGIYPFRFQLGDDLQMQEEAHAIPVRSSAAKRLSPKKQVYNNNSISVSNTGDKNCSLQRIEILALDVGTDEWDWIDTSSCHSVCTITPCCIDRKIDREKYVCGVRDVERAHAVTVHLEWYGLMKDGRKCGRPCCQRWAELELHMKSGTVIGVQNEKNNWGRNSDPQVISSLDYFLTFQPAEMVNLDPSSPTQPKILQYEFAEPAWAFKSALLRTPGGVSNHPAVRKWRAVARLAGAPGPSEPNAISFIQNNCKPLFYELQRRGLPIDSYGACEHNRDSGVPLGVWRRDMYERKLAVLSGHRFDLAIENDEQSPWWNTERLYHALLVHSIPIYQGSNTVFQRIPHRDAIIFAGDFSGDWDRLAQYIRNVSANATLRARHTRWWAELPPSAWENGFPHRHAATSRLSGAMCRVCELVQREQYDRCAAAV